MTQQSIDECNTTAAVVATLARRANEVAIKPQVAPIADGAPFLVLLDENGKERVEWLDTVIKGPDRKTGNVTMFDAPSFISYVTRHKAPGLMIYATPNPALFTAILNDHGAVSDTNVIQADFRDFRALLKLDFSDEWKVWSGRNGHSKAFESTEAFAEFLEVNALDITDPDAAQFLELALNFAVKQDISYSKVTRLTDGHVQLSFNQIVEGSNAVGQGGIMKVPTKFTISVPVFRTSDPEAKTYSCEANFRYRLRGSSISIWYELIRPSKVIDAAFRDLWDSIAKELNVPVLFGEPK